MRILQGKTTSSLLGVLFLANSCFVASCNKSDDEPPMYGYIAPQTAETIKSVFPGLRIDSIKSYVSYGNIKMNYLDNLLVSYKECSLSGTIHDGVSFEFRYTTDTVYISGYKAVIGSNGCVSELICPSGKVNRYMYSPNKHLIKYDVEVVNALDGQYYELTWENDNMVQLRNHFQYDGEIGPDYDWNYQDIFFDYGDILNPAGLLPPLRSDNWINDTGRSMGYGINTALYYAGLLGKGTKNLPKRSTKYVERWHKDPLEIIFPYSYEVNDKGYVISASSEAKTDYYFYR